MISSRSHRAALAGLLLLAGPVAAQGPAPVAPPPPPPPPAAIAAPPPPPLTPPRAAAPPPASPVVDPQVMTLFKQAIAAHQALKALTATITVSAGEQGKTTTRTVTLAYQKPSRAKIAITDKTGLLVQFFTNGKTATVYLVKNKTYQVQPVPPGTDMVPIVLNQANALLPRLLGHPEALNELLVQPGVTATVRPTDPGVNNSAYIVTAVLPTPDGSKATFTFNIDVNDHLLRQVTENAAMMNNGKAQILMLTETVTALSTVPTLTAADFVFVPPPGVTKAAKPKAAAQAGPP